MASKSREGNAPVAYFTDGTACIDVAFFRRLDLKCLSPEYLQLQCAVRGKKPGHPLLYGLLCGAVVTKIAYDTALGCIRSTSMFDEFLGDVRTAKLLETIYSWDDYGYSQTKRMLTVEHAFGFWYRAVCKLDIYSHLNDYNPYGRKDLCAKKRRKLALYDAICEKAGTCAFDELVKRFAWRFDDKPSWSCAGYEGELLKWLRQKTKAVSENAGV